MPGTRVGEEEGEGAEEEGKDGRVGMAQRIGRQSLSAGRSDEIWARTTKGLGAVGPTVGEPKMERMV